MKEPMLKLVENAIRASIGDAGVHIPEREFKIAALAALMALRKPTEAMIVAGAEGAEGHRGIARDTWDEMICAAMNGG